MFNTQQNNKCRFMQRQHPTKHQLYSHLPPITKTIKVRRTRHTGHYWRSRDELISDVLLWTPSYGQEKAGRPAWTYIQQLCEDTGCSSEDLPEAMNNREEWWERVKDICAGDTTRWWWSKCSKLVQKDYKTRHDWVGKFIHRELCKRLKFDHTIKWYMHTPEPVLQNETHKILLDFGIQTDPLIQARRPVQELIRKIREFV